jgi:predicted nucleotidyltransferase
VEQLELVEKVVRVLEELRVPYMLVGSVGSGAWGEPRFTRDIDVVVSLTPDDIAAMVRAFPLPDYYVSAEAARAAVASGGQFNVIHPGSGHKVDFVMARRDAWGERQMARRRTVELAPNLEVCVAAPEDIILGKMLYYREGGSEKHLRDVVGIMNVSGEQVDRAYVADWARELGVLDIWQAVLGRLRETEP